jgi:hypothetical protein
VEGEEGEGFSVEDVSVFRFVFGWTVLGNLMFWF